MMGKSSKFESSKVSVGTISLNQQLAVEHYG